MADHQRTWDAADRMRRAMAQADGRELLVPIDDLRVVLDAVIWDAPSDAWPTATVVLAYCEHQIGRLDPPEQRRIVEWLHDEYGPDAQPATE